MIDGIKYLTDDRGRMFEVDCSTVQVCPICKSPIPPTSRGDRIYCNENCKKKGIRRAGYIPPKETK